MSWRPTAPPEALALRAQLLAETRSFFARRGVLEVETPLLGHATVTDRHIESFRVDVPSGEAPRFLQTSPEYAMKRLLAAGAGSIYQISKAFRRGEAGRRHNPEFTMLEWYRPGFDHLSLMDEVDALLRHLLGTPAAERKTYRQVFEERLGLDPHRAPVEDLVRAAEQHGVGPRGLSIEEREPWLDLLMSLVLEPELGRGRPLLIYDYPASQAALARLRRDGEVRVAERFEAYVEGVELANGYHELLDSAEQRRRFDADLESRGSRSLPEPPVDERLLAALDHGLPACAGVSIGFDRLVMLAAGASALEEVLAFPADRA